MECKFKSKYCESLVHPNQLAAERVMENAAAKNGETLCWKFWDSSPAKLKEFKKQLAQGSRLLKRFHYLAILSALALAKHVTSLGAPFLIPFIEEEQKKLDLQKENEKNSKVIEVGDTEEQPRPSIKKNDLMSRLGDL